MAAPFSVENTTPGTTVWSVDASGNTVQSGNLNLSATSTIINPGNQILTTATITTGSIGTGTLGNILAIGSGGGLNSSLSANYLSTGAGFALGTGGTQLSDITRDYMYYLQCTTSGGATIVLGTAQGNTVGSATIFVGSATATNLITFRIPAGWFTRITGTTAAFANQYAISC